MKAGDKVFLKNDIESVQMFPEKPELPKQKDVISGSLGFITEMISNDSGIVDFDGHKVLIFDLEEKVTLATD